MTDNNAKQTLLQWAQQAGQLEQATLSADGTQLQSNDVALPATEPITMEYANKTCTYTLASVFLQILDPQQSLLAYRNVCKQHNIHDPVKSLDKPTVLGYFGLLVRDADDDANEAAEAPKAAAKQEDAAVAAAAAPTDAAAAAANKYTDKDEARRQRHALEKERRRKEKEKRHRKDDKHQHKDKHHHHRSRPTDEETARRRAEKKKARTMVTNEQLFSNLSEVAVKRQMAHDTITTQEDITAALSWHGFAVTPALLDQYREQTAMIMAQEIPVGNSASILRAANPRRDLSQVLDIFNETIHPGSKKTSSSHGGGMMAAPVPAVRRKHEKSYLRGQKPVIVVPKGMTAPITILNAHDFFANAQFVPRDVCLKQGRRSAATTFTRHAKVAVPGRGGITMTTGPAVEYEIVDNPKKLGASSKEWERIVAVVALGQAWQFKDWLPGYHDPVSLFSKTFGFYIGLEGDKIPPDVQSWSVTVGNVHRDKRGLDRVTYASFWNNLDEWMKIHKPELLPHADM